MILLVSRPVAANSLLGHIGIHWNHFSSPIGSAEISPHDEGRCVGSSRPRVIGLALTDPPEGKARVKRERSLIFGVDLEKQSVRACRGEAAEMRRQQIAANSFPAARGCDRDRSISRLHPPLCATVRNPTFALILASIAPSASTSTVGEKACEIGRLPSPGKALRMDTRAIAAPLRDRSGGCLASRSDRRIRT